MIIKEKFSEFVEEIRGSTILTDKAYININLCEKLKENNVNFMPERRINMINNFSELLNNYLISKLRKIIETCISILNF